MSQAFSKIWIAVILSTFVVGGILSWQYFEVKKEEVKAPEGVVKDETADWKIYRNEGYGFEVKYPKEWEIDRDVSFAVDFRHQDMEENYACISIRFEKFLGSNIKKHLEVQDGQYALSKIKCLEEEKFTLVNIGGIEAFECEDLSDPFPNTAILVSNNNFIYHIEKIDTQICRNFDTEKIFKQILSTFRFIELEETIEETDCEKWRKECAEEGDSRCGPCDCKSCCSGLVKRDVTYPYRNKNNEVFCLEEMTAYTCVKCGDKLCGKGEDWCICPEDCSKPNPEDLQIFRIPE
jgi:ASC-1-like (ASCH) protein